MQGLRGHAGYDNADACPGSSISRPAMWRKGCVAAALASADFGRGDLGLGEFPVETTSVCSDQAREPRGRILGRALLRLEIDVDETEALRITVGPFEIVVPAA